MAWLNRDIEPDSPYGGGEDRPGRVRRLFGGGEDPLSLAFPLLRVGRLRVRVHWVLPLYAACELLAMWIPKQNIGFVFVVYLVGALLVMVLAREIGRGVFARRLGSGIDHVTAWPLGGLNSVASASTPHPVASEAGGLLTNLILLAVLAVGMLLAGFQSADLVSNPFDPGKFIAGYHEWTLARSLLWSAYYANAVLLALNLLPMFPMDMGRIVGAWMRSHGMYMTANERAARVGFFVSVALLVFSAVEGVPRLMVVAIFGFLACLIEARRSQFITGPEAEEEYEAPEPVRARPAVTVPPVNAELDAVLAKISREGLTSLNASEREVLARETERRRRG